MQRKIIKTEDNSKTLLIPEMNETYHSTHGALTEALHIYIKHGVASISSFQKEINIFEMGFGTGLNAILTLDHIKSTNSNINYHTIEKYPVSKEELEALNYISKNNLTDLKPAFEALHTSEFNTQSNITPSFSFMKYNLDIKDFSITHDFFHIIYFDAFAPSHQPDLWTQPLLKKMYDALKPNGFLITYCAQGEFKRTLKSIGFEIIALDGPPGKREITKAIKPNIKSHNKKN
jgi:tRNA U34 5-methylaminomethyl-2-thiouridine-forming methyltransferase MnmC